MSLDDPVTASIEQVREGLEQDVSSDLSRMTLAGVLSLIPGIGSSLQSLLDGKAQQNVNRRWLQLFIDMKEKVEEVRESIPDVGYYSSEEFQTLLAQAYQQILTTHDGDKLKLLATALANSGTEEFRSLDEKEVFLQTLRDLSAKDMKVLLDDNIRSWNPFAKDITYDREILISLQRLQSLGLVVDNAVSKIRQNGPEQILVVHRFMLSAYGFRFLKFVRLGTT